MPFPSPVTTTLAIAVMLLACLGEQQAVETRSVNLRAPMTTVIRYRQTVPPQAQQLWAVLMVPDDAPDDLTVAAWCTDQHGTWYQQAHAGTLEPGSHSLHFDLDAQAAWIGEQHRAPWSPRARLSIERIGLVLSSTSASHSTIDYHLELDHEDEGSGQSTAPYRLLDLDLGGLNQAQGHIDGHTGQRWQMTLGPDPPPANPYDPETFRVQMTITDPQGQQQRVDGFWYEPQRLINRGDMQQAIGHGRGRYLIRFRPRQPGRHQLRLEAIWHEDHSAAVTRKIDLPPLMVDGQHWDEYVRVDEDDPRFFSIGSGPQRRFFWGIGCNVRSINDVRGLERTSQNRLTPDLGSISYAAYLQRLGAAGVNTIEVWMSSWNLALEWRREWPGYHGLGVYNQSNAAKLDAILDEAWRQGIRINLVIHNHGSASSRTNREWGDSPYSNATGGPLREAADYFTDPDARQHQRRLHRYIIARYADHPAILGWKMWSEQNLTAGNRDSLTAWHQDTAAWWKETDIYQHPITTHWSGSYRTPWASVCALPEIDFICCNAYHRRGGRRERRPTLLADLVFRTANDPERGLQRYRKPVVIAEYGGSHLAGPHAQLHTELRHGQWAGMVSGLPITPMMWWHEWIDQHDQHEAFSAVARFMAGEDMRGPDKKSHSLDGHGDDDAALWIRAWGDSGRLLGYILDPRWGLTGEDDHRHQTTDMTIGRNIASGLMTVQWWQADNGTMLSEQSFDHPGGPLKLNAPPFTNHLAFKLWRDEAPTPTD